MRQHYKVDRHRLDNPEATGNWLNVHAAEGYRIRDQHRDGEFIVFIMELAFPKKPRR